MSINPPKRGDIVRIESQNSSADWNFFRDRSNHAYLHQGNTRYEGDCKNNLIISSDEINELRNIKDSFIFSQDKEKDIVSIQDFEKIKNIGTKLLSRGNINYHIPLTIQGRKKIPNYNLDVIKNRVMNAYGINPLKIKLLASENTRNGRYFIQDMEGKEYIFKCKGKRMELTSKIIFELDHHFPKPHKRIDDLSLYGLEIEGEIYGLEDFVEGNSVMQRDIKYIKKVGKTMALLHNELKDFLENKNFKIDFAHGRENFNESNLASVYLDIVKHYPNSMHLINVIQDVIKQDLSSRIRNLPEIIINGDLNSSNFINSGGRLIAIDSETFGKDKRIKEFIAPLILKGNESEPEYVRKGLPIIIEEYNKYSKNPLNGEEISLLPCLLQAATLKYYVVRNIRLGETLRHSFQGVINNLNKIREDLNAN